MLCKTIILSNSQNLNNSPKGILTLSNENNYIKGKIRLYNIQQLPTSTKLGLYIDQKVYISPVDKRPNHYEFVLNQNIDISKSVYCALIDTANNKQVLLEGGSFNGFCFTDSPLDAIIEAKDPELEEEISKALQEESKCTHNCENCEYKKYFYNSHLSNDDEILNQDTISNIEDNKNLASTNLSNPEIISANTEVDNPNKESVEIIASSDDKINFQNNIIHSLEKELIRGLKSLSTEEGNEHETIDNTSLDKNVLNNNLNQDEKLQFLNDIVYQLDEMLLQYPANETLDNIIPNSKFVSVEGDNPYVLGAIYEDNVLKYIAYGVFAKYNSTPPSDLGNHYQWLPLNPHDVLSDGYFMIYQNALTGSIVEINFE